MPGFSGLFRFRGDRGFLNGRTNRITHSGVLRLDDIASPSEIPVLPVQDGVSVGSGTGCVSRPLVGLTHTLTPHPAHFLPDFPYETHPHHTLPHPHPASLKFGSGLVKGSVEIGN